MRLGYLVTGYPLPSHTFVLNEVTELRALGAEVATFAPVRAAPEHILSAADREAAATTFSWRPIRPAVHARAHLRAIGARRGAYWRALRASLARRRAGWRSAVWQLMYFAQGVVLWHRCVLGGIRHVHVHFPNSSSDIAMAATELGGDGWSWSLHIHGPTEFYDVAAVQLARKATHAAFVVCISDFSRSQVMAFTEPESWDRIEVVHCGVRTDCPPGAPRTGAGGLEIVCVGRLVPEKGQSVLLEAVARLDPAVRCTLIGDGPTRAALAAQVRRLGLADRVTLTGAMAHAEVLDRVAAADVFCLPSFAEGVPVSLMEAMVREVPVVSTRVMGIPELVGERAGLLVEPGSVAALEAALRRLATDADLRRTLGAGGRAAVLEGYDLRTTTRALHAVFRRRLGP